MGLPPRRETLTLNVFPPPKTLGVASSKALVLPPKTLGRTLNYTVESGAKGLQKQLNVTHFVDLDYAGFGGGVPLRSSDPSLDGKCPDHIVFIVRSCDIGEVSRVRVVLSS